MTSQALSDKSHWHTVHTAEEGQWTASVLPRSGRLKSRLKRIVGPKVIASMQPYDDHVLWTAVLPKYFAQRRGSRVVEIGSAPGEFLVRLKERFGVVPFGVEYSASGAELNRRMFADHGIDTANVIEADFFEMCRDERYWNAFDVVVSRGFIEHFREPEGVVRDHLRLLKPGGVFFLEVPNLRGFNFALCWIFCRELIAIHNLDIMTSRRLAAVVPAELVETVSCGYHGTFNFSLCSTRPDSPLRFLYAAGMKLQALLNIAFRCFFGHRGADSAWFSPAILFVGIKR